MPLTAQQSNQIRALLIEKISKKLNTYARETSSLPFLVRLLQDSEKVAAYSFIHSLATSLGMSVYEQAAEIIGLLNSSECFRHYDVGGVLSREQKATVTEIVGGIRNRIRQTDYETEMREVLDANPIGGRAESDGRIADLYLLRDGIEHYFEIKTVKPNIDVFEKSKEKLLQWIARRRMPIKVFLAFPYNPYEPEPYERFTQQGMLTIGVDLLIGRQFWDMLGGDHCYEDLLAVFDQVGKEFKQQISDKIGEVARTKMRL